jgi:hypothetical protein
MALAEDDDMVDAFATNAAQEAVGVSEAARTAAQRPRALAARGITHSSPMAAVATISLTALGVQKRSASGSSPLPR